MKKTISTKIALAASLLLAISFTFIACSSDNDNNTGSSGGYKTIQIGEQIWMTENLNINVAGSRCYGDNTGGDSEGNCAIYGRLYDWETAMTVCPNGWHLPTKSDWDALINNIGSASLQASEGWEDLQHGSMDIYGFKALPGGYGFPGINNITNSPYIENLLALAGFTNISAITIEGFLYLMNLIELSNSIDLGGIPPNTLISDIDELKNGFFNDIGYYGFWWSASEYDDANKSYYLGMVHHSTQAIWLNNPKFLLFSVRCLKDVRQ